MTSLSERIELIEMAMDGVTHPDAPAWISVAQDGNGPNGGFWTCAAATAESPRYIRADFYAALARQAEALQQENAELRTALEMISAESRTDNAPIGRSVFKALATCGEIADVALSARTLLNGGSDAQG